MKKEKIYVNKINKKMDNNQKNCDVLNNNIIINNFKGKKISVDDKLKKLFNINGYIFNVNVKIITNSKTYNTKIAGKVGNSIITLNNDVININDIDDIIF